MVQRTGPARRALLGGALAVGATGLLSACGTAHAVGSPGVMRLGYFANLTHAVPLVGMARGTFAAALGGTRIEPQVFSSGPAATESMLAGALDLSYLGPSPAINSYVRTKKVGTRILAGAATGGAALVVRRGLTSAADLRGRTLATPQLGGTQDVALRVWLQEHGLQTSTSGGDDVTLVAQSNAQTLDVFRQGGIDGAWLPEPWVSRLVVEADAVVLVDEATLWPGGVFPTTLLLGMQDFIAARHAEVLSLVRAHVDTVTWIRTHESEAKRLVNAEVSRLAGKALATDVLDRAWPQVTAAWDPVASALQPLADDAVAVGTIPRRVDLAGILDLRPLNEVLAAARQTGVHANGLEVR